MLIINYAFQTLNVLPIDDYLDMISASIRNHFEY